MVSRPYLPIKAMAVKETIRDCRNPQVTLKEWMQVKNWVECDLLFYLFWCLILSPPCWDLSRTNSLTSLDMGMVLSI